MIRILITIIIYGLSFLGVAQTKADTISNEYVKQTYQVEIEINDISSDNGKVYFALYDSETNFNTRKPLRTKSSAVINGKVKILFEDLESNTYAISCFHDANNNGRLDFEQNGIPIEAYGFTNNKLNLGPPQFKDAQFDLNGKDLTFEIKF